MLESGNPIHVEAKQEKEDFRAGDHFVVLLEGNQSINNLLATVQSDLLLTNDLDCLLGAKPTPPCEIRVRSRYIMRLCMYRHDSIIPIGLEARLFGK